MKLLMSLFLISPDAELGNQEKWHINFWNGTRSIQSYCSFCTTRGEQQAHFELCSVKSNWTVRELCLLFSKPCYGVWAGYSKDTKNV